MRPFNTTRLSQKSTRFAEWLDRFGVSGQLIMSGSAVAVGLITGLAAVAFFWLIAQAGLFTSWARGSLSTSMGVVGSAVGLVLVMGAAGLVVGSLVTYFSEAKGNGIPQVLEAMALRGGRMKPFIAVIKTITSAITIGTGGSAGREGPIVQIGSSIGSTVGQFLRFSNERLRTLVACGAAAGISAAFNAPIAGAFFALEVILGNFTVSYFGAVVISSVSASVLARAFLGDKPAFTVPAYPLDHPIEILLYVGLGLLAAVMAVIFIRSLYKMEKVWEGWHISLPIKTTLGMMLTAVVGLMLPGEPALGPSLTLIGEAIGNDIKFTIGLLAAMLILKLIATDLTLGSGNSGGDFAPGLFMGALLGGIVGQVGAFLWPTVVLHPGAYALVGMAAVLAGQAHAPMTGILLVFEMSGDYRLILPLMLATVISSLASELMFSESIYTFQLKLDGISLQRGPRGRYLTKRRDQ